ncbi:MAG: IclR family transcriptional regulator [Actinomycetia bacterium]|nr:IclR family transcriptional regulator [Actinomycetes bacterium]
MEPTVSGVGVLDKSVLVLNAIADRKLTLVELVEATGLTRATAHRLASALEAHGLLRRTVDGRFALGLHLLALGREAAVQFPLAERARPAMEELRDRTGESVQLYVVDGDSRVCVAALESPHGLRTIVPVGAALSLDVGSAGHVLTGTGLGELGWVESLGEREPGVASVSAPICDADGAVVAAISVSGPIDRMGSSPGRHHGPAVIEAAVAVKDAASAARPTGT